MVSDHSHQSHGSANANTLSAPSDLVQLGHVSGAYGIKGWLRIQAYSEHADTLLQCKNWWLQSPAAHHSAGDLLSASPTNPQHHRIQTVREQGKQLVAQVVGYDDVADLRSEEHTSELQSRGHLVCRLLLVKKNKKIRV